MKTPLLETQRLILRPVSLGDAPAIQKHFNNWNIIQQLPKDVPWPYPEGAAEYYMKEDLFPRIESGDTHSWVLVLKEEGPESEAIGSIEFRLKKARDGNRGFWLAEPHWGKGLMTEALYPVHEFVFGDLGVTEFTICNAIGNDKSARVKEKTGARFVEVIDLPHHNGMDQAELWEVTKESWEQISVIPNERKRGGIS